MNRENYGFSFNNITINEESVFKKSKNSFGKIKINNEIEFYLYIINNNINFPIPKLLNYSDGELTIQYIKDSKTMTDIVTLINSEYFVNVIKTWLDSIHSIKTPIKKSILINDVIIETYKKPLERFNEFEWRKNEIYNSIRSVNGIKIRNIFEYCEIIKSKTLDYLNQREHYNLIHGDVHLGNILINKNNELYFIDPRGYFGESKLFGLCEYDYAKLMFGLSVYSKFYNMIINDLSIENNNITIDFIKNYENVFESETFDYLTRLLCLSIWLANNSCFLDINKKITSIMVAYYYCKKYIKSSG